MQVLFVVYQQVGADMGGFYPEGINMATWRDHLIPWSTHSSLTTRHATRHSTLFWSGRWAALATQGLGSHIMRSDQRELLWSTHDCQFLDPQQW